MGKHAYLIMAHNEYSILKMLLEALDYVDNDIYLHIDKKSQDAPLDEMKKSVVKGKLYIIERISVNWGGFSQIQCEFNLLKSATQNNSYDYYHLLTGVNYPLKNQEEIHDFFEKNKGKEFIGFDTKSDYSFRVKYIFLFNEIGKKNTIIKQIEFSMRSIFVKLQKMVGFQRRASKGLEVAKGFVYWSITDLLAHYIVDKEKEIWRLMEESFCGDEIFIQTLVKNSPFYKKLYSTKNEYEGCMRIVPWMMGDTARKDNVFLREDIDFLLNSNAMFAMKFSGIEGKEIIKNIKDHWRDKQ